MFSMRYVILGTLAAGGIALAGTGSKKGVKESVLGELCISFHEAL